MQTTMATLNNINNNNQKPGYADKNGNKTSGLFSAFLHCYHFTTDPCCIQDPQIIKALNAGGVYPDPAPPAWNCIITFNRFFILSCGQLSGAVTGILLSLLSIAIIYVGVSRQDLAAMRQTRSGRDRARYSWVQGWWNNSAFANPAARPASVLLKPTLTAAAGGGGGSQTGRQPALFSPERAQFQRFEDENTTLGEDVTRLRAYSRGPSPGDLRRSGVPRANGVDPLAEMMGGGGGAPAPAMVPEGVPAYRAVYEFRGAPGSVEMELVRVGERLVVLQVNGDGSAVVRSLESGRQGVVPVDILSR
ncbi:hypothetical protein BC830DRAFT_1127535 [Chytriomyces sp. MP71]|nr:hypothetical protein BC830DRAFT_1127535 [Chytriomyces sp. MP71]